MAEGDKTELALALVSLNLESKALPAHAMSKKEQGKGVMQETLPDAMTCTVCDSQRMGLCSHFGCLVRKKINK